MKTANTLAILALGAFVTAALAHDDDPKGNVPHMPVYGSVFHAGEGMPAETFPASGIALKTQIPLNNFTGSPTSGNDCWGYVSPSGREYAIMGLSNGTAFVEITNPAAAVQVAHIAGPSSIWRCMKTYGTYCYAGSEGGGGIQVMDLSNIDGTNTSAARVALVGTVTTGGNSLNTHTLAIDARSGYLYRAGGGANGIRIYDVKTNPAQPAFVGSWSNVYVHECQVVSYLSGPYAGKQIAFCCGGANTGNTNTGMYIVDVTNKAAPTQLSYTTYAGAKYCHQSWLSNDQQRIYINDELDEGATVSQTSTIVMNVANLSAPSVERIFTNGNSSIGHNLYIGSNNRLYEANYRSGIRVFDLTANAQNPPEIAFFDTWPADDAAQFNGLWNVWPYFPSGTFIGSDIERGLFVWRFTGAPAAIAFPSGAPSVVAPSGGTVTVQVTPVAGTLQAGQVKLVTTVNGVDTVSNMTSTGTNLWQGTFPSIACTTQFTWSVRVDTVDGQYLDPTGPHAAIAAVTASTVVDDRCEAQGGWQLAAVGDTATSGLWVNADPVATAAQPENDHTPGTGTNCFVTGNGTVGGAIGAADVDGGTTTLVSPSFDGTGPDTVVSYWRWYSNDQGTAPNEDSMPVSISADDGVTWTLLENVTENRNAWVQRTFRIKDFVVPSAAMRVRWMAQDLANASNVEAAVDDFQVIRCACTAPLMGDFNGDGRVTGADLGILLANWGSPGDTDLNRNGITDGGDIGILLALWTP